MAIHKCGIIGLAFVVVTLSAAQSQEWKQSVMHDELHQTSFVQYVLAGKFLTPPQKGTVAMPILTLHCSPGSYAHGKARGKLVDAFISVGTVIDSQPYHGTDLSRVGVVADVELRLDDRKLQKKSWPVATDHTAISVTEPMCNECAINNLFFGHDLAHKEGTGEQVRKVLIGVNEYLAAEVVMEFDLPDVSQVGDACGVIWHK